MADLAERIKAFATRPHATDFEAALLVAEIVEPGSNLELARVGMATLSDTLPPVETSFAEALCAHLRAQGFKGATDQYYDLDNSRIDRVLATRRGIPISLAIIYLELARRRQVPACGINFPAHFLVQIGHELVDPFAGRVTTREECLAQLGQVDVDPQDAFNPTTPVMLMMRMLNNVRGILSNTNDYAGALGIIDHQLILAPDEPALYLGRAELWWRLGSTEAARQELDLALSCGADATAVAALRRQLGGGSTTVH